MDEGKPQGDLSSALVPLPVKLKLWVHAMSAVCSICGLPSQYGLTSPYGLASSCASRTSCSPPRAQPTAGGTPTLTSPVSWTAPYWIKPCADYLHCASCKGDSLANHWEAHWLRCLSRFSGRAGPGSGALFAPVCAAPTCVLGGTTLHKPHFRLMVMMLRYAL